jgi:hypothetical protein
VPLQKLLFKPGVVTEVTNLANESGWYDCDKVRFRRGFPEKIGGWTALSTYTYLGVARSLFSWSTLSDDVFIGVGTNLKFYISNSGQYNDITPLRGSPVVIAANAFTTTNASSIVRVNDVAHGAQVNDFVTITLASGAINGIPEATIEDEFQVLTVPTPDTFTIDAGVNATSSGTTGGATFSYQINTGAETYTVSTGWGTGPWSRSTWGSSYAIGYGSQLRLWSQGNYGEDLVICPRGGEIYYWTVNTAPSAFDRATPLSAIGGASETPVAVNQVLVADAERIIMAIGCNEIGSTDIDPMLVRWSAQEDAGDWDPSITDQAGGYRFSVGSKIIAGVQARQEILILTDAALYSMQYVGPPDVFQTQLLASNLSLVSPNCVSIASDVAYWMGVDKFYTYTGRVDTLPCDVRQTVFSDINMSQSYQFFSGTNEGFNEVWWFYCSADSDNIDRYVVFNYAERIWYFGTMERTAWNDSSVVGYPVAAVQSTNALVLHENGVDDGTTTPPSAIEAYIQSSDFDIGDGHNFGFVWRVIPDVSFTGSTSGAPEVEFTMKPRQNPGANYGTADSPGVTRTSTVPVQQFTEIVYTRLRGRQMAFKISSSSVGTQWQLGVPRLDVRSDGRR